LRSAAASSAGAAGSLAWGALGVALLLSYPVTAHFARPSTALALLAALVAYVVASLVVRHPLRWLLPPLAGAAVLVLEPRADWLLYVPPVAINLALCWLFGRTLVGGRTPLIARFALMEQATLTDELSVYTRRLTWLWTLLFAGAALASVVLALSGSRDAWSLFTNLVNYLLVAALFLGEFAYRRVRFRNYQHQPLLQLLRNVRRARLFER
jgi:uncharacterized membrane protein